MSQSTPSNDLTTENEPPATAAPTSPAAQTLQAAPAAVKRSLPMALSLCLGILLAALGGWFFYKLTWFFLLLYLSFVAATIVEAPVQWLRRCGIRRGLAAVIIMVGGLVTLSTVLYFLGSGVYSQISAVSSNLEHAPQRINDTINTFRHHFVRTVKVPARPDAPLVTPRTISPTPATSPAATPETVPAQNDFDVNSFLAKAAPGLEALWTNALRSFELVSWLVIMFFIVLYMLVDGADHLKGARMLLPKHSRLEATRLFHEIARAHRGWALASIANVCSASVLIGTGLFFLGVPGAFVLGFIAGLGELIPNLGPVVGALPALLFVLIAEPDKFFFVLAMFIIAQTIQSYTISPQMLKFSIEMPVLVTLLSVLVFGTLFGFLGILVAIPLVADMVVVWNYISRWLEKDTLDYDAVNAPTDGIRAQMAPDNTHPSRLRKLFHRSLKQQQTQNSPPLSAAAAPPPAGLDRLEKVEQRSSQ